MPGTQPSGLYIDGTERVDGLLNGDGTALLIGMLLDQQVAIEWAFAGPATLRDRLGHLDAAQIAAMTENEFVAVCCEKPAIHRFPASMGRRIHAVCGTLVHTYSADGSRLWADIDTAAELKRRLRALPGFGDEKTKILIAILAKRHGIRPTGWEAAAGVFADDQPRSAADMYDADSQARVRAWKQAQRAAQRDKQDRPA